MKTHLVPSVSILAVALLLSGCATTYIKPVAGGNPPPETKFSDFSEFELQPITVNPKYAEGNVRATNKIQEHMDTLVLPMVSNWESMAGPGARRGTLVIKPHIEDIKFVGGGARFWVGAAAGSSAVLMKVTFEEKETGRVIAEPSFYQRAAAMGGAWSMGGHDNDMLRRIVSLFQQYLQANYASPVGGYSGEEMEG